MTQLVSNQVVEQTRQIVVSQLLATVIVNGAYQ